MKVKMLQHQVGEGYERKIGDVCEVEDDEATRLIAAEIAVSANEAKARKTKATPKVETATEK